MTPKVAICWQYYFRQCHYIPSRDHIELNIARSTRNDYQEDTTSKRSQVSCLKGIHGSSWIYAPTNLFYNMFANSSSLKSGTGCSYAGELCGCAPGAPTDPQTPRRSNNGYVGLNATMSCPFRGTVRHELMHTYGYEGFEINNNTDSIHTCISNYWLHNPD
ncbi:MAG: hypothetical protein WBD99_03235 [Thermodesulfobacteriota bacterium]